MWFIGVEVEQETSAPPPKKNPGSAPGQRSRGTGGLKLLLRDILQHTSSFVKRFVYLAGMYHYV